MLPERKIKVGVDTDSFDFDIKDPEKYTDSFKSVIGKCFGDHVFHNYYEIYNSEEDIVKIKFELYDSYDPMKEVIKVLDIGVEKEVVIDELINAYVLNDYYINYDIEELLDGDVETKLAMFLDYSYDEDEEEWIQIREFGGIEFHSIFELFGENESVDMTDPITKWIVECYIKIGYQKCCKIADSAQTQALTDIIEDEVIDEFIILLSLMDFYNTNKHK